MRESILLPAGIVLFVTGIAMLCPAAVGAWSGDGTALYFLIPGAIALVLGLPVLLRRPPKASKTSPQRIVGVALGSLIAVFVSAVPFFLNGESAADGLFEAMSGWTTTGASVYPRPELLPDSFRLWRALMQWLGGLGILMIACVLLPYLEPERARLLDPESAESARGFRPRFLQTGKDLFILYVCLTGLNAILLFLGRTGAFESVCLALSTISTGGFTPGDVHLSGYARFVTVVFMLFGATNFILHLRVIRGDGMVYLRSELIRSFLLVLGLVATVVAIDLWRSGGVDLGSAIGRSLFQSVSFMTTSGFWLEEGATWPPIATVLFVLVTFVGGMVGSTAGGIKIQRWSAATRGVIREILRLIHPHRVLRVRIEGVAMERTAMDRFTLLLAVWVLTFAAGTFVLLLCDFDLGAALSGAASVLNNVGATPGIDTPPWNGLPGPAKLCMAGLMLLGRLEIFSMLVTLSPSVWRIGR